VTYQEWFAGLPPWVQKDIGQPMTVDEFKAKVESMPFYVDETKFVDWFEKPDKQIIVDDFVVDNLPQFIKELFKTNAASMRIGHDYFDIPSHKERDIPPKKFASLLAGIKNSAEGFDRGPLHIGFIIEDKNPWMAVLKTTYNHSEVFLVSLRRIADAKLKKLRLSGKQVYKK
jgi:hypothetical protein